MVDLSYLSYLLFIYISLLTLECDKSSLLALPVCRMWWGDKEEGERERKRGAQGAGWPAPWQWRLGGREDQNRTLESTREKFSPVPIYLLPYMCMYVCLFVRNLSGMSSEVLIQTVYCHFELKTVSELIFCFGLMTVPVRCQMVHLCYLDHFRENNQNNGDNGRYYQSPFAEVLMHIGLTLVTVVPCYLISSSTDGTLIGLFFDIYLQNAYIYIWN